MLAGLAQDCRCCRGYPLTARIVHPGTAMNGPKRLTLARRAEALLGVAFGAIFLALAFVVTLETLLRKVLNVSLQGADELAGYALAVGATLAFSQALLGRAHIRVDVLHGRLTRQARVALNVMSACLLAAFAVLMAWLSAYVIQDTRAYGSVSQTPWATPLVVPQTVWLVGLAIFAVIALLTALRTVVLWIQGRMDELDRLHGPRGVRDEVADEIQDVRARGASATDPMLDPKRQQV